jgi:NAD(P)-dependent dehydrogenase (short-subunit alcohol dehydrogenase family)
VSLAVVTGGSGGIGRACAARFLAAGHHVLLTGRNEEALAKAATDLGGGPGGDQLDVAAFDVTDEAAVEHHLRPLAVDVLVNNAGWANSAPIERVPLADWEAMLTVHATGPFLCTRAVLGGMRERGHGRIISVASVAGMVGAPYIAAYTAAKHAALGLMRATAAEVAGTGITANAVCPGYVDTPMTDSSVSRIAGRTGRSPEETRSALASTSPLGRLITPEEVASAVAYLASPGAAPVNGQTIVLDGGRIFS